MNNFFTSFFSKNLPVVPMALLLLGAGSCSSDNTDNTEKGQGLGKGFLSVGEKIVPVDGSGVKNYRIEITADEAWDAELVTEEEWISMDKRDDHIFLTVKSNPTKEEREAAVNVFNLEKNYQIEIIQDRRRGTVLDVSGDLGMLIMAMSPDGKHLIVMDGDAYFYWDWDSNEFISLDGGVGKKINNDALIAGQYNNKAAIWEDGEWTYILDVDHHFSDIYGMSRDGTKITGTYNIVYGESNVSYNVFSYDLLTRVRTNHVIPDREFIVWPYDITDDGSRIMAEMAAFGYFFHNGQVSHTLTDDMYKTVHVVDTIYQTGYIRDFIDIVKFPSVSYVSPNGKYIAGTIWEKNYRSYNGGETYVVLDGWNYSTYVYYTDTGDVWYPGNRASSVDFQMYDDGIFYSSNTIYDANTRTTSSMTEKVMDEFGIDQGIQGSIVGMSDDFTKIASVEAVGPGFRSYLIYINY